MSRDDDEKRRDAGVEHGVEGLIYASRWLMAPLYLGLTAALAILVITFFRELAMAAPALYTMEEKEIILLVLTLIDISLAGNLVLIILFRATRTSSPRSRPPITTSIVPSGWARSIFRA